eukprot:scaffold65895_cov19-Tisochrysis_lutea.AAC.3
MEMRAAILMKAGRLQEAEQQYRALLQANPDHYRYHEGLQAAMGLRVRVRGLEALVFSASASANRHPSRPLFGCRVAHALRMCSKMFVHRRSWSAVRLIQAWHTELHNLQDGPDVFIVLRAFLQLHSCIDRQVYGLAVFQPAFQLELSIHKFQSLRPHQYACTSIDILWHHTISISVQHPCQNTFHKDTFAAAQLRHVRMKSMGERALFATFAIPGP